MPRSLPRVARRRAETRARILAVAARRFAADGLEGVRLDEVADAADVARGTLYTHFPSKEALVAAVLEPVMEQACAGVKGLARLGPHRGVDALLTLYLELWRSHADPLRVAHRLPAMPSERLAALHGAFLGEVLRIFKRSAEAGILRTGDGVLAARMIASLAVPLLELCGSHPAGDVLFVESLHALLLRD